MVDGHEQIELMRAARKERREDLQEVFDAHVGNTAATILAMQQARFADLLLGADPNAPVDVPVEGGQQSPDFTPTEQPDDNTQETTEESS